MKLSSLWIGSAMLALVGGVALFTPVLGLVSPLEQNLALEFAGPMSGHPLGLGENGVDVLSQLAWSARLSLFVGLVTVLLSASLGVALGAWAGYKRGIFETLVMRTVDAVYAFPGILLVVALAAALGPSVKNLLIVLVATSWAGYARMSRALALSLRERDFVQSARAVGASDLRIVAKHLLPNLLGPILVQMTYGLGSTILTESSLSFLGLGAPLQTPSWGQMLNQGREVMTTATHLVIAPGVALMTTVLGFNLLGDGLRDLFDPKIRS